MRRTHLAETQTCRKDSRGPVGAKNRSHLWISLHCPRFWGFPLTATGSLSSTTHHHKSALTARRFEQTWAIFSVRKPRIAVDSGIWLRTKDGFHVFHLSENRESKAHRHRTSVQSLPFFSSQGDFRIWHSFAFRRNP